MTKVCKTCTFFDPFREHPGVDKSKPGPQQGVCTWLAPPIVHLLISKAELEPTGRIDWMKIFRHQPTTSADSFCSVWSLNTAMADDKPD
jgi:hypothetical protein